MTEARRLLCIGSGWIAARLSAYVSQTRGWSCRVIYQNYKNPAIPEDCLVPFPRSQQEWTALCRESRPNYVVYALGTSFVPEIERQLGKAVDDNVVWLAHFCDAALAAGIGLSNMVVVGSASVYASSESALREDAAIGPTDAYGTVKAIQERLALSFFTRRKLPMVVARQFNTSGAGQDARFVLPSIAAQIAAALRQGRRSGALRLRIGDTAARRDFIAIADTVAAYCTLLESAAPGGVYNVCSGVAHSIGELAQRACRLFGFEAEFEVQDELVRKGERRRPLVVGDPARLRSLGWQPRTSIDELIRELVEFHATRRAPS